MPKDFEGVGKHLPVENGVPSEMKQGDTVPEIAAGDDENLPMAPEAGDYVALSDVILNEDEGGGPSEPGTGDGDGRRAPASESIPDEPTLSLGDAGEGGGPPPEVPPFQAGDDPEDEGDGVSEIESPAALDEEMPKEEVAESVAAFLLEYEEEVIDPDGPADAIAIRTFTHDVGVLADFVDGEKRREFTLPGEVVVTTEISYYEGQPASYTPDDEVATGQDDEAEPEDEDENMPDTDPAPRVLVAHASLEVSVPDQRYADEHTYPPAPLIKYELKLVGEDLVKTVTKGDSSTASLVGREEAAEFMETFYDAMETAEQDEAVSPDEYEERRRDEVREALLGSDDLGAESAPSEPEAFEQVDDQPLTALQELLAFKPEVVYVKPSDRVDYELEDLLAFITRAPLMAKNEADVSPRVDPSRPEARVSAIQIDSLPFARDLSDVRKISDYLDEVEREYGKLEQAGAVVPRHSHFVVRDVDTHKALIFTASLDVQAKPLESEDTPEMGEGITENERAAEIASNYITTCIVDGSLIGWSCHPGFWRKDGVPDVGVQMIQHDLQSIETELFDLAQWLDNLPPSPRVMALREKTRRQQESVQRLWDRP